MSENLELVKQPGHKPNVTVKELDIVHEINMAQCPSSANKLKRTPSNDINNDNNNEADSSISQQKQINPNSTNKTNKETPNNNTASLPPIEQADTLDEMDDTSISNDNQQQLHEGFSAFTDDGTIEKKILICGDCGDDNTQCAVDTLVNITYRIYYIEHNTMHILAEKCNIDITVDDDDRFTDTFHTVIQGMYVAEKSLFKIKHDTYINVNDVYVDNDALKHNDKHNKRVSPKGSDTYYEINIHNAAETEFKDEMEMQQWIDVGLKYKNAGNDLFKMERYTGAIKKYNKALSWINNDFDDALNIQKHTLMVSSYNNLALIYIKLNNWCNAIKYASNVLDIDRNNIKALMRRGQSYLENDCWDLSKKDLKKALSFDQDKTEQRCIFIKKLLKKATTKQQQYTDKQKKLYGGIFQKHTKKVETEDIKKKHDELTQTLVEYEKKMKEYDSMELDKDKKIKTLESIVMQKNKEHNKAKRAESKVHRKLRFDNVTLKRSYKELQQKHKDLKLLHENTLLRLYNLEKKYEKQQKQFGYKTWSSMDVIDWIINLDKKRFGDYYNKLLCNALNERIDGECITKLDKTDLHRMGITDFRDKYRIYNAIQELIKSDHDGKECVVCMDHDSRYCCVPCGHLCLCDKCKNLVEKVCPVCQTVCVSFLRIYS